MCDDLSCSSDEDDLLAEQTWKKTTNQINKELWFGRKIGLQWGLDLEPTSTDVSNGTFNRDGGQLCQNILKSIHNCRSYGPEIFGCTQALVNTRNMCVRDTDASAKWYWSQAGYREGLDAGKEEVLQEGFNKAFSISSQTLFKVAELRGRISSKLSCSLLKVGHLDKKQESKLQALLLDVVNLESDLLRFSAVKFTDWLYDSSDKASSTGSGVVNSEKLDCVQNQHCTTTCDKVEDEASDISEMDSKQLQTFENRSEEDTGKDAGQNDKSGDVYNTSVTDCSIQATENDILTAGTVQSKLCALSEKFFSIVNSQG